MRALVAAAALAASALTGVAVASAAGATAPHISGAPCTTSVTAGTGTVVGSFIVGVTAGSTQITIDCNHAAGAAFAAEASMLGEVGTIGVGLPSVADTSAIATFSAKSTDTGCPAGTPGSCDVATFAVPATFAAGDPQATCPPTSAELNAGLFGCVLAAATAAQQPLAGAEYLLTYATQTTLPAAPTIAATVATGPPGSTVTISDAAANSGYWWGNAVQFNQALALGAAPATPPSTCANGGYGNVPAPFLLVNWFANGSATAVPGSAAGVTISNNCYDGKVLAAPVLGGTIPVPASLTVGTTYTAYLCELNVTPFPSNDVHASADCGPAPAGASWIDASFSFAAVTGTAQAALSVTSTSGTQGTPLALATSGGSGSGAVSFAVVDGTASSCAVTGGALSASTSGTCVVTAAKAADSTYLAVSSTPTTVTLAGAPVVKLATSKVVVKKTAKSVTIKISCANAPCSGKLSLSVVLFKRKSGHPQSYVVTAGSKGYDIAAGKSANVVVPLSGAVRNYLAANPTRPTLQATVSITDNLGKKHTLGRVSLLK